MTPTDADTLHGDVGEGVNSHCRYCAVCNKWHGLLYNCEHYPEEVRQYIATSSKRFKATLDDPDWVDERRQEGVPLEVINIMKVLAGGVQ